MYAPPSSFNSLFVPRRIETSQCLCSIIASKIHRLLCHSHSSWTLGSTGFTSLWSSSVDARWACSWTSFVQVSPWIPATSRLFAPIFVLIAVSIPSFLRWPSHFLGRVTAYAQGCYLLLGCLQGGLFAGLSYWSHSLITCSLGLRAFGQRLLAYLWAACLYLGSSLRRLGRESSGVLWPRRWKFAACSNASAWFDHRFVEMAWDLTRWKHLLESAVIGLLAEMSPLRLFQHLLHKHSSHHLLAWL